jgi:hypothetical protein
MRYGLKPVTVTQTLEDIRTLQIASRTDAPSVTSLEPSDQITGVSPMFDMTNAPAEVKAVIVDYLIKANEMKIQPGVYLIKERTEDEHELHKVFDGEKWYFGAAGISGALQSAELGLKSGEYDLRGPSKPPLRIEVLSNQESKRLAKIIRAITMNTKR